MKQKPKTTRKTRTVKVRATTNNITQGIINCLLADGHSASRINTQGQFVDAYPNHPIYKSLGGLLKRYGLRVGSYQVSGSRRGVADIICCLTVNKGHALAMGDGRFVAIEVKSGLDQMRPEQVAYKNEVEGAGGQYIVFHTFDAFTLWYSMSEFKPR